MPKVQSARTKKYKRCVRKVRKQGTADDPEDVCAAAIFHKDNVTMAKKRKKKWKGTPAQRAALKKGQRALAKWRRENQGNPRRRKKVVGRRVGARKVTRRRVARTGTAPRRRRVTARRRTTPRAAAPKLFHVREGRRYFTGTGFSMAPGSAAFYKSKNQAARAARALSDKLRKPVGVYG